MSSTILVALAGNPNSGKTTIFNRLTGARQHVGNYPGVTVERKEGVCAAGDLTLRIVDLPGAYSLSSTSTDEAVARAFLIDERPDVVVDVLDAANLTRNLYLAVQLREQGVPLVLALNMSDDAEARGMHIDDSALGDAFDALVVSTVGNRGKGLDSLCDTIVATAKRPPRQRRFSLSYGEVVESELNRLSRSPAIVHSLEGVDDARRRAIRLLEDGPSPGFGAETEIEREYRQAISRIEAAAGEHPQTIMAARRYAFIDELCARALRRPTDRHVSISDRLDALTTNRILGIPLFLLLMYAVFELTFTLGEPPMGWLESLFGWMGDTVSSWWPRGADSPLKSLLVDGVIGGVGGVLVFLPNILLLFLAIALLEDSGYMARAAFIMDRVMHSLGLHGKSFIPLLIGFGCSVPAIMATRTLENRRDRLTTMLVAPLMSCGARLPIYALIIPAFFPEVWRAPMLWIIYIIGILLAVVMAKLLRSTIFKGETAPFVMELPPYRLPTLRSVVIHMAERSWLYLRKAGSIILGISIVLWAMTSYPTDDRPDPVREAQSAEAESLRAAGFATLARDLGLPEGANLPAIEAKAAAARDEEQSAWYETQPGFAVAAATYSARLGSLLAADGGQRLAAYLNMRDRVLDARAAFDQRVEEEGLEEDSEEYAATQKVRDDALAELSRGEPSVYAATLRFLDKAEAPWREAMTAVEQARQGAQLANSVTGRIGRAMEPLLAPMGFDWRIGTALIGSFAAKEVFVAQMGIVYAVGEADEESEALRARLAERYSPLVAFCIMLFALISAPCMATIAVTRRESGSWKWAMLQLGGLTALAYVLTAVVFQVGSALGLGV